MPTDQAPTMFALDTCTVAIRFFAVRDGLTWEQARSSAFEAIEAKRFLSGRDRAEYFAHLRTLTAAAVRSAGSITVTRGGVS